MEPQQDRLIAEPPDYLCLQAQRIQNGGDEEIKKEYINVLKL